jgi:hypothetical protein
MDHTDAIRTMAAERYLLNELIPDDRESFEAHYFTCSECAEDLRSAAAFLQEARVQLPQFNAPFPVSRQPLSLPARPGSRLPWWRPAFLLPAFLALLAILVYQNLATVKAMRSVSAQPRFLPRVTLGAGVSIGRLLPIAASRGRGVILLLNLPSPPATYASYTVNLQYPEAGRTWSQTINASAAASNPGEPLPLLIPAAGLEQGPYHLAVYGITTDGHRAVLDRSTLDIEFPPPHAHG